MLLAIDIGNTNITLGVFDGENFIDTLRLTSDKELPRYEYEVLLEKLLKNYSIDSCIIASVVEELSLVLKRASDKVFGIDSFLLANDSDLGIKVNLLKPEEVGADRIANAYGAYIKYPKPAIVVDLGSATTFDIINKDGNFVGGVIMPGLNMQFRSLKANTSKLPRIEAGISERAIGNSTESAILSGVIRGSASAIEGLIAQCEKELGQKAFVVATGGYSGLISQYMTRKFNKVNPSLTLEGLKELYKLNCKAGSETSKTLSAHGFVM